MIYPPSKGPITGPASNPKVQAEIALLLFWIEKVSITRAWLSATSPEPKKPCSPLKSNNVSNLFDKPHRPEKVVNPNTAHKYINFLPKICDKNPKLIIPMAEDIEKIVITQTVTDLVVEKSVSISFIDREIIPISIVNRQVAKQIKKSPIIFWLCFKFCYFNLITKLLY